MSIWLSVAGSVNLELISANIPGALSALNEAAVRIRNLRYIDELRVRFSADRSDYGKLERILTAREDTVKVIGRSGIYWQAKRLLRRKLLLAGLTILMGLVCFLPTRVLFVQVEGNAAIPANLILEKAAQCGICFGASRREVRSERMKNALLEAIPELQWTGVNTAGCVATISVRERTPTQEHTPSRDVCRVAAIRDGIITSCTVYRGNALCRVGQAVKAGDTLVSGYTDCGICIRATNADAEIFAETRRETDVITPLRYDFRVREGGYHRIFSLLVGKNRFIFAKSSRISGAGCAKMYQEYFLTLPGGFTLPVSLIVEDYIFYETEEKPISAESAQIQLSEASGRYLLGQMIAGKIISRDESFLPSDEFLQMRGEYACEEMIGQVRSEEIIDNHGETD